MSSCVARWDNGEVGAKFIRVKQYSTRGQKNIFRVKNKYGTATYDLSSYSNAQKKRFVKRALASNL